MAYPRYMDSSSNAPIPRTSEVSRPSPQSRAGYWHFQQRSCMSGQNFKRLSVFISICLAALSLAVGAIATLRPLEPTTLKSEWLAPNSVLSVVFFCVSGLVTQRLTQWSRPPSPQHHIKQCFYHNIGNYQFGLAIWSWTGDEVREAAFAAC